MTNRLQCSCIKKHSGLVKGESVFVFPAEVNEAHYNAATLLLPHLLTTFSCVVVSVPATAAFCQCVKTTAGG